MTQQRVNPFESKWVAYFGGQLLTLATGEKWLTVSSVVLSILGQCDLLIVRGLCDVRVSGVCDLGVPNSMM